MAKDLIDLALDKIFDAEWKGHRGEKLTERELKWVKLFGRSGKVLRNVYVPKPNGETSEIKAISNGWGSIWATALPCFPSSRSRNGAS